MRRRALGLVLLATSGVALGAADAAPRRPAPVTGTYTAFAPTPEPATVCRTTVDTAKDERLFRAPFPGRLTVSLSGFAGDWALGVFDQQGEPYALSDNFYLDGEPVDRPESVTVVLPERGTVVVLRACNLIGGPEGTVTYVHQPR